MEERLGWWDASFDCDKAWITKTGGIVVALERRPSYDDLLVKVFRLNRMTAFPFMAVKNQDSRGVDDDDDDDDDDDADSLSGSAAFSPVTLLNVGTLKDKDHSQSANFYGFKKNELGSLFETRDHVVLLIKENPQSASFLSRSNSPSSPYQALLKIYIKKWKISWTKIGTSVLVIKGGEEEEQTTTAAAAAAAVLAPRPPTATFSLRLVNSKFQQSQQDQQQQGEYDRAVLKHTEDARTMMLSTHSGKRGYDLYTGKKGGRQKGQEEEEEERQKEKKEKEKRRKEKKEKEKRALYKDVSSLFHDYSLSEVCTNPACNNVAAKYSEIKSDHACWHFCSTQCQSSFYRNLREFMPKGGGGGGGEGRQKK